MGVLQKVFLNMVKIYLRNTLALVFLWAVLQLPFYGIIWFAGLSLCFTAFLEVLSAYFFE